VGTRIVLSLFAVLAITGCSTTKLSDTEPATTSVQVQPSGAVPKPAAQSTVQTVTLNPLDDPKSPLAKRSVYFDFDSFAIKPEFEPVVESHSRFMAGARSAKVSVEGNTDERGGQEYNLALGQKRAEAVVQSLRLLGASSSQMEAVSFGSERPVATGHDEESWAKDRRVDLKYVSR
jgi:peptidoglycan-associated lipoprotein